MCLTHLIFSACSYYLAVRVRHIINEKCQIKSYSIVCVWSFSLKQGRHILQHRVFCCSIILRCECLCFRLWQYRDGLQSEMWHCIPVCLLPHTTHTGMYFRGDGREYTCLNAFAKLFFCIYMPCRRLDVQFFIITTVKLLQSAFFVWR